MSAINSLFLFTWILLGLVPTGSACQIVHQVYPSQSKLADHAAEMFISELKLAKQKHYQLVFILPTGSTPIGLYQRVVQAFEKGEIDLSSVILYNMDEYCGLSASSPYSYASFMEKQLISEVAGEGARHLRRENWHIPNGMASDFEEESRRYCQSLHRHLDHPETRVVLFGGLGAGPAHIAFNDLEPELARFTKHMTEQEKTAWALATKVRQVPLAKGTIQANRRFFEGQDDAVPKTAMTIGFYEILRADRIIIMAQGASKRQAVRETLQASEPDYHVPSSLLLLAYDRVEFLVDQEAYGMDRTTPFVDETPTQTKVESALSFCLKLLSKPQPWLIPHSSEQAEIANKRGVHLAQLPKGLRVLWLKTQQDSPQTALWQKLVEGGNEVVTVASWDQLRTALPADLLVLPEHSSTVDSYRQLSEKVPALIYETGDLVYNWLHPLSEQVLSRKIEAMKVFHASQMARTPFDKIIEAQGRWPSHSEVLSEGVAAREAYLFEDVRQSTDLFHKNAHVHFISPHADDAEIGCGGLMQELAEREQAASVVVATAGHRPDIYTEELNHAQLPKELLAQLPVSGIITDPFLKSDVRRFESQGASRFLHPQVNHLSLNLPLYDNNYEISAEDRSVVDAWLTGLTAACTHYVFMPMLSDQHPAHRAVTRLFKEQIDHDTNLDKTLAIVYYRTPWTGIYQLILYAETGHEVAGLAASEQLVGKGQPALDMGQFGERAERYQVLLP